MILISINNLTKKYQTYTKEVLALDDISFDIYDGEILGILGPSGCGKSTLLNILTGLDKDYTGIYTSYKPLKIGYMMQDDALLPWLTVYENCILALRIQKKLNKESKDYTLNLLKKYDMYDFKDEYPESLSGGMRQRVV